MGDNVADKPDPRQVFAVNEEEPASRDSGGTCGQLNLRTSSPAWLIGVWRTPAKLITAGQSGRAFLINEPFRAPIVGCC